MGKPLSAPYYSMQGKTIEHTPIRAPIRGGKRYAPSPPRNELCPVASWPTLAFRPPAHPVQDTADRPFSVIPRLGQLRSSTAARAPSGSAARRVHREHQSKPSPQADILLGGLRSAA